MQLQQPSINPTSPNQQIPPAPTPPELDSLENKTQPQSPQQQWQQQPASQPPPSVPNQAVSQAQVNSQAQIPQSPQQQRQQQPASQPPPSVPNQAVSQAQVNSTPRFQYPAKQKNNLKKLLLIGGGGLVSVAALSIGLMFSFGLIGGIRYDNLTRSTTETIFDEELSILHPAEMEEEFTLFNDMVLVHTEHEADGYISGISVDRIGSADTASLVGLSHYPPSTS